MLSGTTTIAWASSSSLSGMADSGIAWMSVSTRTALRARSSSAVPANACPAAARAARASTAGAHRRSRREAWRVLDMECSSWAGGVQASGGAMNRCCMPSYANGRTRGRARRAAAGQPRDAGGGDRGGGARLPAGVPVRPAGGVAAALAVAAAAARRGAAAARAEGCRQVRLDLAARRLAAGGAHACARGRGRAAPARRRGGRRDALWRAVAGHRAGTAARAPGAGAAAVSAVLDHHHRQRRRRGGRGRRVRPAGAHGPRLPPRPGLGRRGGRFDPCALAGARARRAPGPVLPRPAAARGGRRRPLRRAVRGERRRDRRSAGPGSGPVDPRVPVALRRRKVVATGHHGCPRRARRAWLPPGRCRLPRLRRRLPGDAGRDRDDAGGALRRTRRHAACRALPQRRAGARRRAGGHRPARTGGPSMSLVLREFTLDVPLGRIAGLRGGEAGAPNVLALHGWLRSEEHTSELQSRENLVCRLLLEKKKNKKKSISHPVNRTHKIPARLAYHGPGHWTARRAARATADYSAHGAVCIIRHSVTATHRR